MSGPAEMAFMMPSNWHYVTPAPNTSAAFSRHRPTGAVIRFSGWANAEKADEHWQKLREFLIKGGIEIVGEPTLNQYDPPWTLPFLRRNEIIVPVNRDGSEKESAVTELS